MYFPKRFSVHDAVETAQLVALAYEQFEAFEGERAWALTSKYTMVCELFYPWESSNPLDKITTKLDNFLKRNKSKNRQIKIPIGFIARAGSAVYVIFRGTQTAQEWANNLNQKLKPCFIEGCGSVHEGFSAAYQNIRAAMIEALEKVKGAKVLIAGHSLGAAFATFAAIDIERTLRLKVHSIYTFGSPRVGNDAFAQAYNGSFAARSFRIVNTSDIVTSIPFPAALGGIVGGYFSHVDTPVDFTLQSDEVEKNHNIHTYLDKLAQQKKRRFFLF